MVRSEHGGGAMPTWTLRLLGPMTIESSQGVRPLLLGRKGGALLACVASHGSAGVPRSRLLCLLWDHAAPDDARNALEQLEPLDFGVTHRIAPGIDVQLRPAGHILGASSVELRCGGVRVLFSGDVGRPDDPIMFPPVGLPEADYIVLESTYGDRQHAADGVEVQLAEVIARTVARGGIVVIPAFAVGRAQALLYLLSRLQARGAMADVPVYLNSPMAIDMTDIYLRHRAQHRLTPEECAAMCRMARMVRTTDESRVLSALRAPAVIVSASGMATGGRVLHHLKALAPDPRNSIVFAGYQAGGTRGARLVAGERTIRIFGQDVAVNAEVVSLQGMSAHADAGQLVDWLRTAPHAPKRVFLTHGEPAPADLLRQRIFALKTQVEFDRFVAAASGPSTRG